VYFAAYARQSTPAAFARVMILSSTSVMLRT
jgi:hypothetical protein